MSIISEIKFELMKALSLMKTEEKFKVYSPAEISISEFKVGGKVELIATDGSLTVATDGDYELEDGSKFTVKDGLIESIEGQAPEEVVVDATSVDETANAATVEEDAKPEDFKSEIEALKSEIQSIKDSIDELMKANQAMSAVATKQDVESFKSEVTKLNETIVSLAKLPVELSKTNPSNVVKDVQADKVMDFIKMMKNK